MFFGDAQNIWTENRWLAGLARIHHVRHRQWFVRVEYCADSAANWLKTIHFSNWLSTNIVIIAHKSNFVIQFCSEWPKIGVQHNDCSFFVFHMSTFDSRQHEHWTVIDAIIIIPFMVWFITVHVFVLCCSGCQWMADFCCLFSGFCLYMYSTMSTNGGMIK